MTAATATAAGIPRRMREIVLISGSIAAYKSPIKNEYLTDYKRPNPQLKP
ncbi:MAG: hypothetical protein ACI865_003311 [Flavobacteriaceae bacterium]|jgi:hypothetical protein